MTKTTTKDESRLAFEAWGIREGVPPEQFEATEPGPIHTYAMDAFAAGAAWARSPIQPSHEQMMAGYEVACRFGVYEKRAFDLAEAMFKAMSALSTPLLEEPVKPTQGGHEGSAFDQATDASSHAPETPAPHGTGGQCKSRSGG